LFGRAMTRLVAGEDVIVMQVTDPQCRGNTRPRQKRQARRPARRATYQVPIWSSISRRPRPSVLRSRRRYSPGL